MILDSIGIKSEDMESYFSSFVVGVLVDFQKVHHTKNYVYKFIFNLIIAKSLERRGAVAQWYSQRTSVLEIADLIPAPIVVELL